MPSRSTSRVRLQTIEFPLERDAFMRTLLRHLVGTLEDLVGAAEASGLLAIVGQQIGDEIDAAYRAALDVSTLDRAQVSAVCLDLKRRIEGDFYVIEEDDAKIVFGNRACPFGDKVLGRPSMCMMTSNVFGVIASQNLGYGKVALERTIAEGHTECRVVLYLKRTPDAEAASGREYVRDRAE